MKSALGQLQHKCGGGYRVSALVSGDRPKRPKRFTRNLEWVELSPSLFELR
jgi:hypothetical protein